MEPELSVDLPVNPPPSSEAAISATLNQELDNQNLQIDQSTTLIDFLQNQKVTNQRLYTWMVGQLSSSYFKAYQLAFDAGIDAARRYSQGSAVPQ